MRAEPTTREKLLDIVKGFDTAMLVTRSLGSGLRARPMAIADVEANGSVWFVTSADAPKIDEIADRSEVVLTMQGAGTYASLTGIARTVRNAPRSRELWKESWRIWFPDGPEEDDLVLIVVEPSSGEFWDSRGTRGLRYLWEAARARARGDDDVALPPPNHGKVEL